MLKVHFIEENVLWKFFYGFKKKNVQGLVLRQTFINSPVLRLGGGEKDPLKDTNFS